ncbi:ATP-binding protein [Methanolobus sp. WCC5]|uniref:ATP-binding protein n=1 Tax=Methanolobus sp. WCC5 TaxID=3125785 RepID=UPI0032503BC3
MDTKQIKELIEEQKQEFEREIQTIRRQKLEEIDSYSKIPHIVVITGLRRAGKSTLLKQIKKRYYPQENIYYMNFEDERLLDFKVGDFNALYESFLETSKESKVFFFDEIQNIPNWEAFVRRMYDRGFKFYITGSNSSLMSRELGTKLTGRHVKLELYPFSFKELIGSKGIETEKEFYLTEERARIKKEFSKYLENGGIPEYYKYGNKDMIRNLYDNILYRDIIVRYGVKDESAIRSLAYYLITNPGTELSYNRLKNLLGIGSQTTVKNYIDHLENSYLTFTINAFDYSLKKQIYSKKKVYIIDTGLMNILAFKFSKDTGKILENIVFLELKNRGHDIYYHVDKNECDFILMEKGHIIKAIQVAQRMERSNEKREISGLLEAMEKYGLKEGLILTEDTQDALEMDGRKISVRPVWKWLLE